MKKQVKTIQYDKKYKLYNHTKTVFHLSPTDIDLDFYNALAVNADFKDYAKIKDDGSNKNELRNEFNRLYTNAGLTTRGHTQLNPGSFAYVLGSSIKNKKGILYRLVDSGKMSVSDIKQESLDSVQAIIRADKKPTDINSKKLPRLVERSIFNAQPNAARRSKVRNVEEINVLKNMPN